MTVSIKNTSQVSQQTVNMLVHAPAGYGKTTLCGTTGEPTIILSAEAGLLSLSGQNVDYIEITCLKDLREAYDFLLTDKKYKWVCMDSISELVSMALIEKKRGTNDPRQAYTQMRDHMLTTIREFRNLPKNTYMTCQQSHDSNELLAPITDDRVMTQNLPYMFDLVFALRKMEHEGKLYHVLQTEGDETYLAKHRIAGANILKQYEPCNLQAIYSKITNQ
jgi:phage nucleotide-binding protein